MKWSIGAHKCWRALRAEIHSTRHTATWTQNNRLIRPIHEVATDIEELKRDVCDFIVEIRKLGSLYDLLQGLSMFLECEHSFENKLMSVPPDKSVTLWIT